MKYNKAGITGMFVGLSLFFLIPLLAQISASNYGTNEISEFMIYIDTATSIYNFTSFLIPATIVGILSWIFPNISTSNIDIFPIFILTFSFFEFAILGYLGGIATNIILSTIRSHKS